VISLVVFFDFTKIDNLLLLGATGAIGKSLAKKLKLLYPDLNICGTFFRSTTHEFCDTWQELDLENLDSIKAIFNGKLKYQALINCSGYLHGDSKLPERKLEELDMDFLKKNYNINFFGPALLTQYFVKQLSPDVHALIAHFSAQVASLEDNKLGGWHSYRGSKSSLNMFMKNVSIELKRSHPNAFLTLYHPGMTKSHLSSPYAAKRKAKEPDLCVEEFLESLSKLKNDDCVRLKSWNGETLPW